MTCFDGYAIQVFLPIVKGMDIVIFDLTHLRMSLLPHGDATSLLRIEAPHIGVLANHVVAPGVSQREAVYRALDSMLATFELPSSEGKWCPVAFYNPLSYQIAYKSVPETMVYGDGHALDVHAFGSVAQLRDDVLVLQDIELPRIQLDAHTTKASLAAHSRTR